MARKTKRQRSRKEVRRASASKRAEKQRGGVRPYLNLPSNVTLFDFEKEGSKKIDIIEYVVGKGNPEADKGDRYFERTFYVHKGIGPDNETHLCPKKTFGKPCPVCKHRTKMGRDPDADDDTTDELKPKERQLFVVMQPKKKKAGIQILDKSYHLFGKELDLAIRKAKKKHGEEAADKFASPDEGMSVLCEVEEKSYKKANYTNVKMAKLVERDEQYDEDLIEQVPCLDKLLVETPYEELKQLFDQSGDDADDDDDEDDDSDSGDDDDDSDDDDGDDDDENSDDADDDDDDMEDDETDEDKEDDSDDDDDDDDDDGDEEDEDPDVHKGDTVKFTYKGKKRTGVVKRIRDGLAYVKEEGRSDAYAVDPDDLIVVQDDEDEAYDEDDEDEKPKRRKKGKKKGR